MKKIIYSIIVLVATAAISSAQTIPNAGFENWTTVGTYNNPDSWGNLNSKTAAAAVFTCEKGTPGYAGSSYLKVTSRTVTGMGVVPGKAVCGVIDTTTYLPVSGMAFTGRPAYLKGYWQHMIYGSSQGYIDVKLTRWDAGTNTRVQVASAHTILSGMAMSWAAFTIPMSYTDSNAPDTCVITLSASGTAPTNLDYLWVDALTFFGTQGINEYDLNTKISLYPNPSTDRLVLDLASLNEQKVSVSIIDMTGNIVKSIEIISATSATAIDISDVATGNYIVKVIGTKGIASGKFIKK